jgi:hypothetical protein
VGKTNAEESQELARKSPDCSFLLTHLIRQNDGKTDSDAQHIMSLILDLHSQSQKAKLLASKTGWYSAANAKYFNPEVGELAYTMEYKSVCFTESTLSGLKAHRDMFGAKYGLSFDREFLFNKGAAPCINIPSNIFKSKLSFNSNEHNRSVYNFVPKELHPYINVMNSSFDASHEREWRHHQDMDFKWSDIKFIFCPEEDFAHLSKIQVNGLPTLFDLAWLDRV